MGVKRLGLRVVPCFSVGCAGGGVDGVVVVVVVDGVVVSGAFSPVPQALSPIIPTIAAEAAAAARRRVDRRALMISPHCPPRTKQTQALKRVCQQTLTQSAPARASIVSF
ncbi:hypothetical protein GCM10009632_14140 [Mycolicibacterium alvei]|uniref:Uncharacterized protein n=1 Tax=Mycolicibacterium alvei TaxID=67081 RepID=A0A6N4UU03_9MYCO|nr:hypothetical protein MALV_22690 [Mycolicibacterium alvei]